MVEDTENKLSDSEVEIKEAIKNLCDFYGHVYDRVQNDLKLISGNKGDVDGGEKDDNRANEHLPLLRKFSNRIVNPTIDNPYSIELIANSPMAEKLKPFLEEYCQDVIQRDESQEALETSLRNSSASGYGGLIVTSDYNSPRSMSQTIRIEEVQNPTLIMIDNQSERINGSDANLGVAWSWVNEKEATREHGDEVKIDNWSECMYSTMSRKDEESIPEMLFVKKEYKNEKRVFTGRDSYTTKFEELEDEEGNTFYFTGELDEQQQPVYYTEDDVRTVKKTVVVCTKYVGAKLIDKSVFEMPYINIIPTYGDLDQSGDKYYRSGISKLARPASKIADAYLSTELDLAGTAPISPYLMPAGGDDGFAGDWDKANTKIFGRLKYNAFDENGNPLPPPMRNDTSPKFEPYIAGRTNAEQDMAECIGINDINMGRTEESNQSGKSVFLRQTAGDTQTIHYQSNLQKTIKQVVNVIIDMHRNISVYPDVIEYEDEQGNKQQEELILADLDYSSDDFSVNIVQGPMYANEKRQKMAELREIGSMMGDPRIILTDLIREAGYPGSSNMIRKINASLPPEMRDEEEGEENPVDGEALQVMEQQKMHIEELEKMLDMAQDYIIQQQTKELADDNDREADLIKTQMNNETKVLIEGMKQSGQNDRTGAEIIADARKNLDDRVANFVSQDKKETADMLKTMAKAQTEPERPPIVSGPVGGAFRGE